MRGITQQGAGFGDVGHGVANVAGTEILVNWRLDLQRRIAGLQSVLENLQQLVQGCAFSDGDVVGLVDGFWIGCCCGQEVGLDNVVDVAEVASGFAVAIDADGLTFQDCVDPLGDDGGVGAIGVLARAENVELAQADGLELVGSGKGLGVEFVNGFGGGVWRKDASGFVFHFGGGRIVAINGAAGGKNHSADFGVAGCNQHIDETGDVAVVAGHGLVN